MESSMGPIICQLTKKDSLVLVIHSITEFRYLN